MTIQSALDVVLAEANEVKVQAEELVSATTAFVEEAKGGAETAVDDLRARLDELAQSVQDRLTALREAISGITD